MTEVIPVSVGKKYKDYMDQLKVCATGNGRSVASEICRAVKFYIQNFEETPLLANDDKWKDFINNASKKELMEMNTLLYDLNYGIIQKCKKKIEKS